MDRRLQDLISVAKVQDLLDRLHDAFSCPTAVIDTEGNVLTASGWADACTDFHRRHPVTAGECRRSDLYVNEHVPDAGGSVVYRCPRGLVECASPIIINGRHVGSVLLGPTLPEKPDLDFFAKQARSFDFDEQAYLAAISRLTIQTQDQLERRAPFIRILAETIAEMGLVRLEDMERARQFVEAQRIAHFGSWDLDGETQRMAFSVEAANVLGLRRQDAVVTLGGFWTLVHTDDQARVAAAFQAALKAGAPGEIEHRIVRETDGALRFVYQKWEPSTPGGDGRVLGVLLDITERKLAERLLKRYELLSDQARDIILFLRRSDGRILEANEAAQSAYGYSREELLKRHIHDLREESDPTVEAQMTEAAESGALLETTHRRSDGTVFPVEVSSTISTALGEEPVLMSVVRDVSERRQGEERRQELALALEHERDELRARQAFSDSAMRIGTVINSTLASNEIMRRVVESAGIAFACDSAAIVLHDKDGWSVEWAWGQRGDAIGQRFSGEQTDHIERAIQERRAVAVNDCSASDGRRCGMCEYWQARAVLTVPLIVAHLPIGCLSFVFSGASHDFTPLEVEFATEVGLRVSQALGNAHLFEEQRDIARTLQESYLHPLSSIAGVEVGLAAEMARKTDLIGGDLYDAFELDSGSVVALVGDVSGKGVAAAGLAAIARNSIHAFAMVDGRPDRVLERTNELLLRRQLHGRFVTALLLLLNPDSGEISWASAGHPPALRLDATGCRYLAVTGGTPLGAFPCTYEISSTVLEPGDSIVVYTDGVTEARRGRELFGPDRLLSAADRLRGSAPQDIADGVRDAARRFAGELTDDAQVLALRWLAKTAPG